MTPGHTRSLQAFAEYRLASRFGHAAANGQPLTPILRILHPHRMLAQVAVGFPELIFLPLAELVAVVVVPHHRTQYLGQTLVPVAQPTPPFGKPGRSLSSVAEQGLGQLMHVAAGMPEIHDPLPRQLLPWMPRIVQATQHLLVVFLWVIAAIG